MSLFPAYSVADHYSFQIFFFQGLQGLLVACGPPISAAFYAFPATPEALPTHLEASPTFSEALPGFIGALPAPEALPAVSEAFPAPSGAYWIK